MQAFLEENMSFSSGGDSQTAAVTASTPQTGSSSVKLIPTGQVAVGQRAGPMRVTSGGNCPSGSVLHQSGGRSLLSKPPNPLLSSSKNSQTIVVADSAGVIRSVPAPVVVGGGVQKKQIFTLSNSLGSVGSQVSLLNPKSHKYFSTIIKNKKSVETFTDSNHKEEQNVLLVSGSNSVPVNQSLTYILPKSQKAAPPNVVYTQVSGSQSKRPLLLMTDSSLQTKPNISIVQSGNFSASLTSARQESVIVNKAQPAVTPPAAAAGTGKSLVLQKDPGSPEGPFLSKADLQTQDQILQKLKPGKYLIPRNGNAYKGAQAPVIVKCKKQEESFGRLQATSLGQIVSSNPSGSVTNFQISNGQILTEKVSRPHMLSLLCDNYKIEVVKQESEKAAGEGGGREEKGEGKEEMKGEEKEGGKGEERGEEGGEEEEGRKEEEEGGKKEEEEEKREGREEGRGEGPRGAEEEAKAVEEPAQRTEVVGARHGRRKQELAVKQDAVQVCPAEVLVEERGEGKGEGVGVGVGEGEKEGVGVGVGEREGEGEGGRTGQGKGGGGAGGREGRGSVGEGCGSEGRGEVVGCVDNSDPEKENRSGKDAGESERFDPTKWLEWAGNIGSLPLSDLKFRLNEFGLIEVVEEEEEEGKVSSKSSVVSEAEKTEGKSRKSRSSRSSEEILRCHSCGTYGMGCEFVSSRFCSTDCSKAHEEEKAQSAKKLWLKEEKKLKLKQQKSLLFQQRAKLEELGLHEAKVTIEEKIKMLRMERELMKTNAGDSDAESCSGASSNPERTRASAKGAFSWTRYLTLLKAKSAPYTLFKDPFPSTKNNFKKGMKLEGIDPVHPSLFCVLTVAAVRGYRIKLHFDGYPDCHDFWVNANSSDIFHAGWCERTNHKLSAPKGYEKNFNWGNYLRLTRTVAAPKSCFVNNQERPIIPSGFRTGMKLEAVDKKNSSLVCVATIADVLDNRILVHFDSWDDIYDYWVDCTSPYIHPVGWCKENGHQLTPPNDYKDPGCFSWDLYLRETKSLPAPARAFKPRTTTDFRRGMKLECVDKRNPVLIRVATVVDIVVQQIKIKFDGWPDQYAYWLDDDSPDIHPAGWCQKTGHPLEPPPSEEDIKNTSLCPTPGCRGIGHVKGKHPVHHMVLSCPYSSMNYLRDDHIPDRFCSKREYYEVKETSASKGTKPRPGIPRKKLEVVAPAVPKAESRGRKRKTETPPPPPPKKKCRGDSAAEEQAEVGARGEAPLWAKSRWDISETVASIGSNPLCWTPSQVAEFVENINNSAEKGKLFTEHQIDGEALLMLSQNDLVQILGFKLGPAIKLYKSIVLLRERALEMKNGVSS